MPRMILDIYHGERGIDLAKWQSKFGLWGVIPKCGGSDDNRWNRYEETTWVEQATQAKALGLHVGAFYYSDALNATDALEDAKHCVNDCMRGVQIDMPIYLDIEERSQLNLPKSRLTEVVTTFCDYIVAAGYQAGIYSGYEGLSKMETSRISGYSLWLACWQESWPRWASEYDLWQEGSMSINGTRYHRESDVDGPGRVDLDWASDAFVQRIEGGGGMARKQFDPANEAAEIHAFMCTDPRFGYSQDPRWGGDYNNGEIAVFTSSTGHTYRIPCGSYDCSSSTTLAWKLALSYTKYAGCLGDNIYECTSTMRATFCKTGLFMASLTFAKRGDLYLNEGVHVAMCQDGSPDNDILSEFNMDEHRRASGGQPGDQTGGESVIRGYYNDNWNTVLHYIGGLLDDMTDDGEDSDDKEATPMGAQFVILDDDPTEHFTEDGVHLHAVANGDEKQAIIKWWEKMHGVKLNPTPIRFGSKDAPWGARYNDVMSRGANFAGFERFNRHPSTRAVMHDENKKQTTEIVDALKK